MSFEDWMLGPPFLIGDRIAHIPRDEEDACLGTVRWLGRLPDMYGHQLVAGVFLDEPQILGTCNGTYKSRRLFSCHQNHGRFIPVSEIIKEEEFFSILARQDRDLRSASRSSSRSDRTPLYMNTNHQPVHAPSVHGHHQLPTVHASHQHQAVHSNHDLLTVHSNHQLPTYQNHFFETLDCQDRGDWSDGGGPIQPNLWQGRREPRLPFGRWDGGRNLDGREQAEIRKDWGRKISQIIPPDMEESFEGRLHDDVFLRQDSYENTAHLAPRSEVMRVEARPDVRLEARSETRKSSSDNSFKQTDDGERVRSLLVGGGQGGGGGGGQEEQQDLLLRLEDAISRGDHRYAAALAKQLSKIKISSRLVEQEDRSGTQPDTLLQDTGKPGREERKRSGTERQISKESKESRESDKPVSKQTIKVQMYVEDAVSAQGPISVDINPAHSVADLKLQIEGEFEIPVSVQRWILGRNLVTEDTQTISSHGVEKENQEIYLYLVLPEEKEPEPEAPAKQELPVTNSPPRHRIPPSNQPFVKGRYWNYEEERWSFCNSDDDEERTNEIKDMEKTEHMKKEEKKQTEEKEVEKEEKKEVEKEEKKDEKGKEEEGEWEYYYEDVEEKKDNARETEKDKNNDKEMNEDHVPEIIPQKVPENITEWECPVCTLMNPLERPGCQACTTERPAQLGAAAALPAAPELAANLPEAAPLGEKAAKTGGLDAYKQLENLDIIPNAETFECVICFLEIEPGDGVVLRECLHTFCRVCLGAGIEHSDSPKVKCPYKDENYSCDMDLLEREIKALVSPAVYEKHQKKSVKEAEANIKGAFHCKTPDCAGWTVIEDNVNVFKCPLCKRSNCITCQAVHDDMDCKQYQQYTLNDANDENTKKTKEWIDGLIGTGEALYCPSCQVLLLKKWGCDWVRCTYCRTEICWVTKQLRWGPNGRGDTSGGCKCMVDGRTKCHKLCNYCH